MEGHLCIWIFALLQFVVTSTNEDAKPNVSPNHKADYLQGMTSNTTSYHRYFNAHPSVSRMNGKAFSTIFSRRKFIGINTSPTYVAYTKSALAKYEHPHSLEFSPLRHVFKRSNKKGTSTKSSSTNTHSSLATNTSSFNEHPSTSTSANLSNSNKFVTNTSITQLSTTTQIELHSTVLNNTTPLSSTDLKLTSPSTSESTTTDLGTNTLKTHTSSYSSVKQLHSSTVPTTEDDIRQSTSDDDQTTTEQEDSGQSTSDDDLTTTEEEDSGQSTSDDDQTTTEEEDSGQSTSDDDQTTTEEEDKRQSYGDEDRTTRSIQSGLNLNANQQISFGKSGLITITVHTGHFVLISCCVANTVLLTILLIITCALAKCNKAELKT